VVASILRVDIGSTAPYKQPFFCLLKRRSSVMGRIVPVGVKEPFEVPPQGLILWRVDSLTEDKIGDMAQVAFRASLAALEPQEVVGLTHTELFFIGTEEDPNASQDETWVKRASRLKQFVEHCGVTFEGQDTDLVCSAVKDRRVLGLVTHKQEPALRGGKENPYAGRTRANVSRWFAEGEKAPHVEKGAPPANGSQTIPPPTPQAQMARPVGPAPARPMAATSAIPKRIGG
jgi:hypothetical protein